MDETGARRLAVLLVEDDPAARRVQAIALERAGPFQVLTAGDGREALDLLRQSEADAVVTDLHMPGMDGFQLVAEISTRYPGLPLLVLTATPGAALPVGPLHIHSKPPDYAALAAQIRALHARPKGSVRGVPLPGLLQLLQWESKTATVTVHGPGGAGHLYVKGGRLIHAEWRDLQGKEAVLAMCAWISPPVEFVDACRVEPAFSLTAEELQMELALRRDEHQS